VKSTQLSLLKTRLLARFLRILIRLLGSTWKIEWVRGREQFYKHQENREPILLCTWHNRMLFYAWFLEKYGARKGWPWAVMTSRSRDGELGAEMGRLAGVHVIRGSSGRGGSDGLRQFYKLIRQSRASGMLLMDGSRGPIYEAKIGTVVLSRLTGSPLVPSMWSASREWVLRRSWDHFRIPKPFARIHLVWDEPIQIPRRQEGDDDERSRRNLEKKLNDLRTHTDAVASGGLQESEN